MKDEMDGMWMGCGIYRLNKCINGEFSMRSSKFKDVPSVSLIKGVGGGGGAIDD